MRTKLLFGNWKMNKTPSEAKEFALGAGEIASLAKEHNIEIGVAPTYVCLQTVKEHIDPSIKVAAQNCSEFDHGAYTGEVALNMLSEIGIDWVIIGHSERRTYNGETSEHCNAKIKAILAANMTPLYCCGESLQTFEAGKTDEFVAEQIKVGFAGLSADQAKKVVIAYEPIWAIGTGKNATKEIAEQTIKAIRDLLSSLYDKETADSIRILYGGSVKPNNIAEYMSEPDIDGALVGGASLTLDSYLGLLKGLIG